MSFFDLSVWKGLWNLNKPQKEHRSFRSNDHMYSSFARLNFSSDSGSVKRRYLVTKQRNHVYDVDGRPPPSQNKQSPVGRRSTSLPASARKSPRRRPDLKPQVSLTNSTKHRTRDEPDTTAVAQKDKVNGMVEAVREPPYTAPKAAAYKLDAVPFSDDRLEEALRENIMYEPYQPKESRQPADDKDSSSDSGVKYSVIHKPKTQQVQAQTHQQPGLAQSSWYANKTRPQRELTSSGDDLDSDSPLPRRKDGSFTKTLKEPQKSWDFRKGLTLGRKASDDVTTRYDSPARYNGVQNGGTEATAFETARSRFAEMSKKQDEVGDPQDSNPYNEPLRQRIRSQQDMIDKSKVEEQYRSEAVLTAHYDQPKNRKGVEIQKRESLYTHANNSGLPEDPAFRKYTAQPARILPVIGNRPGGNLRLLEDEGSPLRTSTPRSSVRKPQIVGGVKKGVPVKAVPVNDTDWLYQEVVLERTSASRELGFTISGGKDKQVKFGDDSVYVSQIGLGGIAERDGRLRVGDLILSVNSTDFTNITHVSATSALKSCGPEVILLLKRYVGKVKILQFELQRGDQPLGLAITGGVGNSVQQGDDAIYIKKVFPDGVAQRSGGIEVGDQLLSVDGFRLDSSEHHEAVDVLRNTKEIVVVVIAKTGRVNPLIFANHAY